MALQLPQESSLTIAVYYPGNSLMHQVSDWSGGESSCGFQLCFPESVQEIQSAVQGTSISIVDATEEPARATAAFVQLIAEFGPECVSVYTEQMHAGLELFVRSRGALLLLGPMSDASWAGLFEAMRRCADRRSNFRFPARQPTEEEAQLAAAWLQEERLKDYPQNRFRKIA